MFTIKLCTRNRSFEYILPGNITKKEFAKWIRDTLEDVLLPEEWNDFVVIAKKEGR